eukprot:7475064-Alexandrium_andersonii.AAC.1
MNPGATCDDWRHELRAPRWHERAAVQRSPRAPIWVRPTPEPWGGFADPNAGNPTSVEHEQRRD